jgi:hypothetical protein
MFLFEIFLFACFVFIKLMIHRGLCSIGRVPLPLAMMLHPDVLLRRCHHLCISLPRGSPFFPRTVATSGLQDSVVQVCHDSKTNRADSSDIARPTADSFCANSHRPVWTILMLYMVSVMALPQAAILSGRQGRNNICRKYEEGFCVCLRKSLTKKKSLNTHMDQWNTTRYHVPIPCLTT